MSRKSSYEEALPGKLEEIPLPDEDDSWEKMNKLLDEKPDRARPFWFLRNYLVLGLLILLLIGSGIWFVNVQPNVDKSKKPHAQAGPSRGTPDNEVKSHASNSGTIKYMGAGNKSIHADRVVVSSETKVFEKVKSKEILLTSMYKRNNKSVLVEPAIDRPRDAAFRKQDLSIVKQPDNDRTSNSPAYQDKALKDSIAISSNQAAAESLAPKDSMAIKDSLAALVQLVKPGKRFSHKYLISAGLGIQQQIQVGGQQAVKYGYNAGSLASDYIPSAWIILERKDKWFLQTGFVYSSPRLVKEFAFNRQTKSDTLGIVSKTLKLKKTFYSQLPLTFNYYVKSNWSVGAGMTFTRLRGAIAEKETSIKNSTSQTPLIVKEIVSINSFTDSFLYRSHSFFTLQTDYQWKRVSVGLKYSKDLQSYIKYTMPDGAVIEGRNWGLQAVLRVKLWQRKLR